VHRAVKNTDNRKREVHCQVLLNPVHGKVVSLDCATGEVGLPVEVED